MSAEYEDHFTAYLDILGFSEASAALTDETKSNVLALLRDVASLRSNFSVEITKQSDSSTRTVIRPAISAFSDNIVLSYSIPQIAHATGDDEPTFYMTYNFIGFVANIASRALRMGFLLRGGATIGKLYHEGGVVFGEALLEAYKIESRVSTYPRIVVSSSVLKNTDWLDPNVTNLDEDGLRSVNYILLMIVNAVQPGEAYNQRMHEWLKAAIDVMNRNRNGLEASGKQREMAKWIWFSNRFKQTYLTINPGLRAKWNITEADFPWR